MILFLVPAACFHLMTGENNFRESTLPPADVLITPAALLKQVEQVIAYFQTHRQTDRQAISPGLLSSFDVSLPDVEETLLFCRDILREDLQKNRRCRLRDPVFLNKHFRVLRLRPYPADAAAGERMRITKYAVFTIDGRNKKEGDFTHALYELPADEAGMSIEEAQKHKDTLSRYKYTKQMVKSGAYEQGGAKPLVWVSETDLEQSLMQGTVCVKDEQGKKRYFNVSRSNDIPYRRSTIDPKKQKRYWYFTEVTEPKGYGMDINAMINIYADAALAGDISSLGLGKLIAVKGRCIRLGILADTGGFFSTNLDRLDYFTGVFANYEEFKKKASLIPDFADVYILVKRRTGTTKNFYK
jgi:hypothetical protein